MASPKHEHTAAPQHDPLVTDGADAGLATRPRRVHASGLFALGAVTNFFDALGVGSFATTTAVLRLGRVVDDENIPGTLNVGHAIPTALQAALFLTAIPVDRVTLVSMVAAGGLGAWFGAGMVIRWPRRTIQRAMAISLLVTATFILLRQLKLFPSGGNALGLTGGALLTAVAASLVIGSLTSLGIGNYAPTMAVTYMLGMDPKAVFPIMATAATLILPTAAIRFFRSGRFDRRTALGLATGGVPGVLVAVFLVKALDVNLLRWIVVGVLIYTSATLYWSSRRPESALDLLDTEARPAAPDRPLSGQEDDRVTTAADSGL